MDRRSRRLSRRRSLFVDKEEAPERVENSTQEADGFRFRKKVKRGTAEKLPDEASTSAMKENTSSISGSDGDTNQSTVPIQEIDNRKEAKKPEATSLPSSEAKVSEKMPIDENEKSLNAAAKPVMDPSPAAADGQSLTDPDTAMGQVEKMNLSTSSLRLPNAGHSKFRKSISSSQKHHGGSQESSLSQQLDRPSEKEMGSENSGSLASTKAAGALLSQGSKLGRVTASSAGNEVTSSRKHGVTGTNEENETKKVLREVVQRTVSKMSKDDALNEKQNKYVLRIARKFLREANTSCEETSQKKMRDELNSLQKEIDRLKEVEAGYRREIEQWNAIREKTTADLPETVVVDPIASKLSEKVREVYETLDLRSDDLLATVKLISQDHEHQKTTWSAITRYLTKSIFKGYGDLQDPHTFISSLITSK